MSEESTAMSEGLSCVLPCFEVLDKGDRADEVTSTIDLVSTIIDIYSVTILIVIVHEL